MTAASIKSLKWADSFLYALTDPRGLYRHISSGENSSFYPGFVMPVAVAIIDIITFSILGREGRFFYYKISYGWIFLIILYSVKIILFASLMEMLGQFLGYGGKIKETISLLNYSLFPRTLLLPIVFIFKTINFAPVFFYLLFSIGLFLWSAYVAVQGISEMNNTPFGRALLIFLFPYLLLGIALFFMAVLAFICGMGLLFA